MLAAPALVLGACVVPVANASVARGRGNGPRARLTAAFLPKRLGAPTTVAFTVHIGPVGRRGVPAPISRIEFGYPGDLGLATSGLGLAACEPVLLEAEGTRCPANSKMGHGSALVEVPFGPEIVPEDVTLDIYAAPSEDGRLHLTIFVHGKKPVLASLVMSGVLLPGRLQISVPAIVGIAGGPDVSLVSMSASIGGALTYYEHVGGRTIAYRPRGIGLPDSCPRGGWRLAARFAFIDGTRSRAKTVIPCPPARHPPTAVAPR